MVALHFRDALITFTFPGGDRVLFIPGGKQLSLLAGKIQLIAVAHIEVGAGDGAASAGRGLGDFIFKIDLHGALAVLAFTAVSLAVHKVAAIAIHLTD